MIPSYSEFLNEAKNQKILFLDIDGVLELNNGFDKTSVENLNLIVDKFNPLIIISSDQRIEHSKPLLKRKLKKGGLKFRIHGFTTTEIRRYNTMEEKRYLEIREYLKKNSITNYVVIDDMNLRKYFKHRYIGTSYSTGFTGYNIIEIEKIWDIKQKKILYQHSKVS